jgi:hypothetical protein
MLLFLSILAFLKNFRLKRLMMYRFQKLSQKRLEKEVDIKGRNRYIGKCAV